MRKRLLSWLLVLTMMASLIPSTLVTALAAELPQTQAFTVTLGYGLWDEAKEKFSYPHAVLVSNNNRKPTLLTVSVSKGQLLNVDNATATDITKKTAIWVYAGGASVDEVEAQIQKIEFSKEADAASLTISVNANLVSENFSSLPEGTYLTQWDVNGHYYMWIPNNPIISWHTAYNNAKTYVLGGMKGYLATVMNDDELKHLQNITMTPGWIGGCSLKVRTDSSGAEVLLKDDERIDNLALRDVHFTAAIINATTTIQKFTYWACGPEAGTPLLTSPYYEGYRTIAGVNRADMKDSSRASDDTYRLGGYESALQTEVTQGGINDIPEGNFLTGNLSARGTFVEFGGYEAAGKTDPGNVDPSLVTTTTTTEPKVAVAKIGTDRYYPLSEALKASQAGDTVEIIEATIPTEAATIPQGVILKKMDGTTYTSTSANTAISYTDAAEITLTSGSLDVAGTQSNTIKVKP